MIVNAGEILQGDPKREMTPRNLAEQFPYPVDFPGAEALRPSITAGPPLFKRIVWL
jgi:hypothetical protein